MIPNKEVEKPYEFRENQPNFNSWKKKKKDHQELILGVIPYTCSFPYCGEEKKNANVNFSLKC